MEFMKEFPRPRGGTAGSLNLQSLGNEEDLHRLLNTLQDPDGDIDAAQFNFGGSSDYVMKGENGLMAVPPPSSFSMSLGRPRSNSGSIMSRRLRSASDMHHQGVITSAEKATLKSLILSRDPRFREEFAKIEKTGEWTKLRDMLRSGKWSNIRSKRHSIVEALDDFADVNLADLPEDLSSVFDNAYSELERSRGRKRAASKTTPVQRVHKKASSPSRKSTSGRSSGTIKKSSSASSSAKATKSSGGSASSGAPMDQATKMAKVKQRKNERERRRRLAVSRGFEDLFKMLKLPQTARIDKATILQNAITRIQSLEKRVAELERSNGVV